MPSHQVYNARSIPRQIGIIRLTPQKRPAMATPSIQLYFNTPRNLSFRTYGRHPLLFILPVISLAYDLQGLIIGKITYRNEVTFQALGLAASDAFYPVVPKIEVGRSSNTRNQWKLHLVQLGSRWWVLKAPYSSAVVMLCRLEMGMNRMRSVMIEHLNQAL